MDSIIWDIYIYDIWHDVKYVYAACCRQCLYIAGNPLDTPEKWTSIHNIEEAKYVTMPRSTTWSISMQMQNTSSPTREKDCQRMCVCAWSCHSALLVNLLFQRDVGPKSVYWSNGSTPGPGYFHIVYMRRKQYTFKNKLYCLHQAFINVPGANAWQGQYSQGLSTLDMFFNFK